MELISLNTNELYGFTEIMERYGDDSLRIINDVLHNEGADEIKQNIQSLLPQSGRRWKGKKTPAKSAKPFQKKEAILAVNIVSRHAYNYLYFPDDGSNTIHHAGNQMFMYKGAEKSADKIADLCLGKLVEAYG